MKEEGDTMNFAIILAGGNGSRMNSSIPKQYIEVNNKPIIMYSIEAFQKNSKIDKIIIVANSKYHELIKTYCLQYKITKLDKIIEGGSFRQESVLNALNYLKNNDANDEDIILIHDAARPLVSQKIIDDNITECKLTGAVVTAIEVTDTIFLENENKVSSSLERSKLRASQTPQTFYFKIIDEAHQKFKNEIVTDDVQMVLKNKSKVSVVNGDKNNFKITTDNDLLLFKEILNASK